MKKFMLVAAACLIAVSLRAQEAIAISAYAISGFNPPAAYETFVIDAFTAELARFPAVAVLDRRAIGAQLDEIELSLSGLVDSNGAVEAGALIGARWILTGSLVDFGGASAALSAQLISTSTGEVAFAATEIITGAGLPAIQERVRAIARELVRRFEPGAERTAESLWLTKAPDGDAPGKPILIWVMSNVDDAADPNGVWYLGPAQLKTLTDRLKEAGHGVVAHDRRTLAKLTDADLSQYSQVWIIEGDGDSRVDVDAAEAAALKKYYDGGGAVWLSAENAMEPSANWIEDVNAFAKSFGASLGGIALGREPGLATASLSGPLFEGVDRVVYDDEIGMISLSDRGFSALLEAPADSRIVGARWTVDDAILYALKERLRELSENPEYPYTYGWLFGPGFDSVGKPAGTGKAVMVLKDERVRGRGMILIDSGWLIGWAFNGAQNRIQDTGQNVEFLINVADYFAGAK